VGYIASQIAHQLGLSEEKIEYVFELGLIHDCGVSTEQMHSNLVNHFDWEDAHIHCQIGHLLLRNFKPLRRYATPILYHHTPYEKLKDLTISDDEKLYANLIFLADRIDIMSAAHYAKDILVVKKSILEMLVGYKNSYFDPRLVEAFLEIEKSEAFWISLEDRHVIRYTWDMSHFNHSEFIELCDIRQLSLIIAYIVDQKSPFTAQHSARVGVLAKYIAEQYGVEEFSAQKIEIAGYLHDIGKLQMPDNILEKPGSLNATERSIINQHSYETYEILRRIKGLEDIALWAGYHHETINGTGYPFHPSNKEFAIEARILAVADIFQALVQDRPYRKGMQIEQVTTIIKEYSEQKRLDSSVVEVALTHLDKCFEIASGNARENSDSENPFFLS
jgi:putative nucleotidyltransferase with HDIG domain